MIMKTELLSKRILLFISIVVLVIFTTGVAAEDTDVDVRVNAPEYVAGTFEVTIDIENVNDLDSGQFDLSFDSGVVNVEEVEAGSIDDTEIPVAMWRRMDDDMIRVLFNLPGDDVASGSGYLTKIVFEIVGDVGGTSVIDISDGLLFEPDPDNPDSSKWVPEISANWFNDNITVGTSTSISTSVTTSTADTTPTPVATFVQTTSSDSTPRSTTSYTPAAQDDIAVPTEISERDEPDGLELMTTHNFIAIYSFIGLLAFSYTLILLR
jgi:hypothetical protein